MTLQEAFSDATHLAQVTIEFAGGSGALAGLSRKLGLDPGAEGVREKVLDIMISNYLNDFMDNGMIDGLAPTRHAFPS